jgi:predicted Rossmann-fold nucleotide-binding protein
VTWSQLGIHSCPIILLNVNGFYTPILEWIIQPANADIVVEAKSVDDVVEKLKGYVLPDSRHKLDWSAESPLEVHGIISNGS